MKSYIALGILILGVLLSVYLGVWVMFIGGIAQVINSLKETPVNAMGFAIGAARFFLAALTGWTTFMITLGIVKVVGDE